MKTGILTFCFALTSLLSHSQLVPQTADGSPVLTYAPMMLWNGNTSQMSRGNIGVVAPYDDQGVGFTGNPALLQGEDPFIAVSSSLSFWAPLLLDSPNLRSTFAYGLDSVTTVGLQYSSFSQKFTVSNPGVAATGEAVTRDQVIQGNFARKFGERLNLGIAAKYYRQSNNDLWEAPDAFGFDIGLEHEGIISVTDYEELFFDVGVALQNLGGLIGEDANANPNFIPANLSLGGQFSARFTPNELVRLEVDLAYALQKLLVPTRPIYDASQPPQILSGYSPDVPVHRSWLQSFYDAPGSVVTDAEGNSTVEGGSILQEEINEITHQQYLEIRTVIKENYSAHFTEGIHLQHRSKGSMKFLSLGLGVTAYGFRLNLMRWMALTSNTFYDSTTSISVGYRFFLKSENAFAFPRRKVPDDYDQI